ncbi:MAG: nucleoside phosphorylase [Lachnospiraceae bacterium]|nr:nucleoside phosphorylase [Lachnospiraceae bacterium]
MKLTEYDSEKTAIINPEMFFNKLPDCPKTLVTCFAENLISYGVSFYPSKVIGKWVYANGEFPLYELTYKDRKIGFIMSTVGAPSTVAQYEELFAMGVENILVFGTCGVLDKSISDCSVIIPNKAVRDEGTSYHYLPESDEIKVNANLLENMVSYMDSTGVEYTVGKTWTTDAIYRETRNKMMQRKNEGCICVDMECSAVAAVAEFRNKQIAQFFYSADNLDSDTYDKRSIANGAKVDVKQKILNLALDMAINIF